MESEGSGVGPFVRIGEEEDATASLVVSVFRKWLSGDKVRQERQDPFVHIFYLCMRQRRIPWVWMQRWVSQGAEVGGVGSWSWLWSWVVME